MNYFSFFTLLFLVISSCSIIKGSADNPKLQDQRWEIVAINQKPISLKGAFIEFNESKRKAAGKAACNSFSSDYETGTNNQLTFGDIVTTKMYCEGVMDTENEIITNLQQIKNYQIKSDMLYLYNGTELIFTLKR